MQHQGESLSQKPGKCYYPLPRTLNKANYGDLFNLSPLPKKLQTLATCDTLRGSRPNRDHGDRTNDMYRPPWRFGQKCAHEEVCAKTKANSQLYVYTRFPSGTCLGEWRKNELKTYSMLFVSYAYYDVISVLEYLWQHASRSSRPAGLLIAGSDI